MNVRIDLNEPKILQTIKSDRFGEHAAQTWKDIIDPYTPKDTGLTMESARIYPWIIHYIQPWSAYIYNGKLYVDPIYNVGAFFNADYGFWSRPGVKKIPSGKPLNYQKNNPYATDHWDKKAEQAGQKEKLAKTLESALKSGRF